MIIRGEKNKNYTVLSNVALDDPRLSLKAKGFWAYIMSKPDNWNISISGAEVQLKESKDAIRSAFKELEDTGYLVRGKQLRDGRGKFYNESAVIYETPRTASDKPTSDKPTSENPTQVNTNIVSTNKVNNNTNVLLEHSSLLTPQKIEYGDPDVNAVIKAFEEKVTKRKLTQVKKQRQFANTLIKSQGLQDVLSVIDIYAAIQGEPFAPHIDSLEDLLFKWEKIMGFGRRRVASQGKNKAVDLSEL